MTQRDSLSSKLRTNSSSINDEDFHSIIFKGLIRETTVFKYYVELKEDALTEQGFFDLVRVPSLRVTGAGYFLKNLRIKNCFRQIDLAKIIDVSRSHVNNWENNYSTIPLDKLVKIAEANDISRDTIYSLINQGKFSLKTDLPAKFEQIRDIIQHFTPHNSDVLFTVSLINCSDATISIIRDSLNVNPPPYQTQSKRINSKELYNYLKTFFRYTKVSKIQPPLTSEVKTWYDKGVDLKRAIICPCLQSDGSMDHRRYTFRFNGDNKILHDYFVDAMYYEYNELPSSYLMHTAAGDCYTEYGKKSVKKIVDELLRLAGNTKTSPANGQSIDEYLKEAQPHLDYLLNAPLMEQQIALRIWASTEGFISMYRKRAYIHLFLGIGCSHPILVKQLKKIGRQFHIRFAIGRSKSDWSGINALQSSATLACINFLKLGGFIKGVKISSRSKYHEGIDKDVLTLGILEFKKREKENQELRNLSIKRVHHEVNKIIENKQYNKADYFINYFT